MPLPEGWYEDGIRPASGVQKPCRFYVPETTATADFEDNAFAFAAGMNYHTVPLTKPGDEAAIVLGDHKTGGAPRGGGVVNPVPLKKFLPAGQPQKIVPAAWPKYILVTNLGGDTIEISFDGVNPHGFVLSGKEKLFLDRGEGGISIRGDGIPFAIEAW